MAHVLMHDRNMVRVAKGLPKARVVLEVTVTWSILR